MAARAIEKSAKLKYPQVVFKHIDLAEYITYPFKKTVVSSYEIMVKRIPKLWGFCYEFLDSDKLVGKFNKLTKYLKSANAPRFYNEINEFQPDSIVCTHFLAAELILNSPKKYKPKASVSVLITDYDLLASNLIDGVSHFFVPTEKIKWKIINRKKQIAENITVSGIPIDPRFYEKKDKNEIRKKHGIALDKPLFLILSGGMGFGKIDRTIQNLLEIKFAFSLISIACNNPALKKKIDDLKIPENIFFKSLDWTDEMPDFIKMADIVICKPGGLTTTECLVCQTPMITIDPIPGQEEANAHFILENQLGKIATSDEEVKFYVEDYLKNKKIEYRPQELKGVAGEIILDKLINFGSTSFYSAP